MRDAARALLSSPTDEAARASVLRALGRPDGLPPVFDFDAERAVLSAMMLDREASSRLTVRPRPADFGLPRHQVIARAIVSLRMKGEPVDAVTVAAEIRASGVTLTGPELAEIAAIVDATPAHHNVAAHAKIVVDLARQRRAVEALDRKRVEGYERHEDVGAWLVSVRASIDEVAAPIADGAAFDCRMFDPLPETKWTVPGLALGPGAPCGLFGFSYSAKSLMAQDLGLCIALEGDEKVFGEFRIPVGGKVRHVDFEQGRHETANRYQRLARGRGIPQARLEQLMKDGMLGVCSSPGVYLSSPGALDVYRRIFEGIAFGLVDSILAAQPGVKENDAQFAEGLYVLGRVSEDTGCTMLSIGHTGKVDLSDDKPSDGRAAPRGSSSIIGSLSTAFVVAGAKGEPKKVSQIKGRSLGAPDVEDFFVEVESVRIDGWKNPDNPADGGGIRLVYRTKEQVDERKRDSVRRAAGRDTAALEDAVFRAIVEKPGCSGEALARLVRDRFGSVDDKAVRAARDELLRTRRIHVRKGGQGLAATHHPGGGS